MAEVVTAPAQLIRITALEGLLDCIRMVLGAQRIAAIQNAHNECGQEEKPLPLNGSRRTADTTRANLHTGPYL